MSYVTLLDFFGGCVPKQFATVAAKKTVFSILEGVFGTKRFE
jgi:hypothetical protein